MREMINALVAAKEAQGMTNQQLADISGVPIGTVGRILSGSSDDPKFQTVCQLAAALKVSMDGVAFGVERGEPKVIAKPSAASDTDKLVNILRDVIQKQQTEKRILFIALMALIAFVMVILIIDLTNPNVGWFRSALEATRGVWNTIFGTGAGV